MANACWQWLQLFAVSRIICLSVQQAPIWVQDAVFAPCEPLVGFGSSVSISSSSGPVGFVAAAATSIYAADGKTPSSSSCVYQFTGTAWSTGSVASSGLSIATYACTGPRCLGISSSAEVLAQGMPAFDGGVSGGGVQSYRSAGKTWKADILLKSPSPALAEEFGWALAMSGDGLHIAVGAVGFNSNMGMAFVCDYASGTSPSWPCVHAGQGGDQRWMYGSSLALSADATYLWVAAVDGNAANNGYVSAYKRSGGAGSAYSVTNVSIVATPAMAPSGKTITNFGCDLALSADGRVGVIGMTVAQGPEYGPGVVGVYTMDSAGDGFYYLLQILSSPDAGLFYDFGASVTIDSNGSTIVVGAPAPESPGRAIVFARVGGQFFQQTVLQASNGSDGDQFGAAVSMTDKNRVVVGAPQTNAGAGAVYSFALISPSSSPTLTATSSATSSATGSSTASSSATATATGTTSHSPTRTASHTPSSTHVPTWCPPGHFGAKCAACPGLIGNATCSGHGSCSGSGTRSGDGSCSCDSGWLGTACNTVDDSAASVWKDVGIGVGSVAGVTFLAVAIYCAHRCLGCRRWSLFAPYKAIFRAGLNTYVIGRGEAPVPGAYGTLDG